MMVNLERALVKKLDPLARSNKSKLSQFTDDERLSVGMTPDMFSFFQLFITEGNGIKTWTSFSMDDCNEVMAGPAGLPSGITELIALLTKHQIVRT